MPEPEPVTLVTDKILQGEIIAGMGDNMKLRSSDDEEDKKEETVEDEEKAEASEKEEIKESEQEEIDDSFYTKSNKITEKDLEDDMDTEFVEASNPVWDIIKIVLIILLIAAIILVGYFIFVK